MQANVLHDPSPSVLRGCPAGVGIRNHVWKGPIMGMVFIGLAWIGMISVFAIILFIVIAIIDPTGNLSHNNQGE